MYLMPQLDRTDPSVSWGVVLEQDSPPPRTLAGVGFSLFIPLTLYILRYTTLEGVDPFDSIFGSTLSETSLARRVEGVDFFSCYNVLLGAL